MLRFKRLFSADQLIHVKSYGLSKSAGGLDRNTSGGENSNIKHKNVLWLYYSLFVPDDFQPPSFRPPDPTEDSEDL